MKNGHTAQRVIFDYGYDLFVQTFNANGELEKGYLLVQIKATEMARRTAKQTAVAVTVERRDLEAWLDDVPPVLLVLYEAATETAYFLLVQNADVVRQAAKNSGTTVTLRIPASNLLDSAAVESLHDHKNHVFGA